MQRKKTTKSDEKVYVVSDIEMGRGDETDDFTDDDDVASFIDHISKEADTCKTTLVLNGDIIDFLKMQFKGTFPFHITEEMSLWKLEETFCAHPKVFDALKRFLKKKRAHVFFVIGNHDFDLVWPKVQKRIKEYLESKKIKFDYAYDTEDIRAEHGHLQDPFYANDTTEPFTKYKGKKILNAPWGVYVTTRYLVPFKKKFPFEERHYPNPLIPKKFSGYKKASRRLLSNIAFNTFIVDPLKHRKDPARKLPKWDLTKHVLKHGFEFLDDEKFVNARIEKVAKQNPDKKIIVLGHAHVPTNTVHRTYRAIITDTWRNEIDIESGGKPKPKTYAEISYAKGILKDAELKEWQN